MDMFEEEELYELAAEELESGGIRKGLVCQQRINTRRSKRLMTELY